MGFTIYKRYWHGKTHISHFALHLFFIFNQNFHVEYTITISNRVSVYYYDTYIIAKPLCYHCISQKIGLSLFLGVFFISFLFISIIFLKQFSLFFLLLELICSHRYRFSSKCTWMHNLHAAKAHKFKYKHTLICGKQAVFCICHRAKNVKCFRISSNKCSGKA